MARAALSADQQKLATDKAHKNFMLARSEAINIFATLETHLCQLFISLLSADPIQGSQIFHEIIGTRERLKRISSLFKEKFGDQYRYFFDSLISQIDNGIAISRNKIVHWLLVTSTTGGKPANPKTDTFLAEHPDMFKGGRFYLHQVKDFSRRTYFFSLLVFYFNSYLTFPYEGDPSKSAWREIFSAKIACPPLENHQLYEAYMAWPPGVRLD